MHRIFIVEDDTAIAAALQKHLTTWGFDVRCAEDFRNVLAECTAFDPQLVLLDIMLPDEDGLHILKRLVPGAAARVERAGRVPLLGVGQYEHRHGHEYGRR